jgi:LmbE family N-acetylglucosaminyl deacetylase
VREDELRCAAKALGAASLELMDYIDPTVGPGDALFPFSEDVLTLTGQLVAAIRHRGANALLAHGPNGEYGHPAHILVHKAAQMAVEQMGSGAPLFYTVQGAFENHPHPRLANVDAPAHLLVDVASVLEQKTAAAMCHRTQHALFVRRGSEEAGRLLTVAEVVQPVESLHRIHPAFDGAGLIQDELAGLLWASGAARHPNETNPA